ncbi:MAG: preprotein translocase subunit YajC, partial [Verrucomicrobiota bacterium]
RLFRRVQSGLHLSLSFGNKIMTINDLSHLILLAQEGGAGGSQGGGGFQLMIFMLLMFVMMYFLTIRPQRQRQKQLQAQIAALKTGDRVITTGGIHGLVTNIKDSTIILKVADNVKIEMDKPAVATVVPKASKSDETDAESKDESSDSKD